MLQQGKETTKEAGKKKKAADNDSQDSEPPVCTATPTKFILLCLTFCTGYTHQQKIKEEILNFHTPQSNTHFHIGIALPVERQ